MTSASQHHYDGHSWHPPMMTFGLDGVSLLTVLGALSGALPAIAAMIGAVWYSLLIYDWISRRVRRRRDHRS